MATLTQLRSAILRNIGRSTVSSTETADVTGWINQFIREGICADHNFPAMRVETSSLDTVDGTDTYTVPETATGRLKDVESIYFRSASTYDWRLMTESTEEALLRNFTELTEGKPYVWAMSGARSIRVRPIPDAAYTNCFRIFSWEYFADLSADGDSNEATLYHSQLIEWAVTARGYAQYGDDEKAAVWQQRAEREHARTLATQRRLRAPARRTLRISLAANKPLVGLRRSQRSASLRNTPYDWV